MVEEENALIRIDLAQFKLHLNIEGKISLSLHFNSESRRFYLSVIALVINEMKKSGVITSIPLEKHHDTLALLNETVGRQAGSSDMGKLSSRIYRKWRNALPDLEHAPLFRVLGKSKEYDADGKIYRFTDQEKDAWANLFDYRGSHEQVRLRFSIDKLGVFLDDILITFADDVNPSEENGWDGFLKSLKKSTKEEQAITRQISTERDRYAATQVYPHTQSPGSDQQIAEKDKLNLIQRYLPQGLAEKIIAQRGVIEGERKQVTVMFCDMRVITPHFEDLDPEEIYSITNEVFGILTNKVHDYGGTVNEMSSDGIMALFGAPMAQENAPHSAIRSALAIHREMARYNDRIKIERQIPRLKMRIGIHTGSVVVGSVGNDLRIEFKAVGNTVNLASRMEELAEPGTTYVTQDTYKLTEGLFQFEAMRGREAKGKGALLRTYRVISATTRRTRFDVNAERGLTPFVGRERELKYLLEGYQRAREGRGQAFSIVSEAGVGKSRLLYEFRKAMVNEDVTFLEGRCLSYGSGVTYYPAIDLLKSNFDIRDSDSDLDIRNKVKRGLEILGTDEASTLPYLLGLLGVEDSGIDERTLSPEGRKERTLESLKRIVLKGSEIRPLIMAIEDLHWIDKSSEEAFKYLLDAISGARVLLIFTYRPEFAHSLGSRSYHSQVNLNRLSDSESLSMVTHLLGTEDVENDLEELILKKTEGVPFFIEEFVKSLIETKIIEIIDGKCKGGFQTRPDVSIPSTIQDVIMARVDSLPDEVKGVIQVGSVIEREFSHDLIQRVTGLQERELLSHLSALKDSELIYERGIFPQSTYIFKHALTREVVYDSILSRRKKELHGKIADAIEEIYEDNLDEHYSVLSEHYSISENYEKGARYYRLAGKSAKKKVSFSNAINYAVKTIDCLEKLPPTEEVEKQIIDARTTLGLYYVNLSYYAKANNVVSPVVDLTLRLGYKRRLSQIYSIIGNYNAIVEENYSNAFKYLEEALKISEELNDNLSSATANYFLGFALYYFGEFEKAHYYYERALRINEAAKSLWSSFMVKSNIDAFVNIPQGNIDLAYQRSREDFRLAEESDDMYSKAIVTISYGSSCYCNGLLDKAEGILLNGIDLCERLNNLFWVGIWSWELGNTYFDKREYKDSYIYYNKAMLSLERVRAFPSLINLLKIALTRAKVMNNEKDIDLEELYRYAEGVKVKLFEGWMHRYMGEILLNVNDEQMIEAEHWLKKAIVAHKSNGMMFQLGRDHLSYAELLKKKGDIPKARENLSIAARIFEECGADGDLIKAKTLLEELA